MSNDFIFILCWVIFSITLFLLGIIGLRHYKNPYLGILFIVLMAQPFSWTFVVMASGGGSFSAPIPDIVGLYLFLSGAITYETGEHYVNYCFPPSPLSTFTVSVIIFYITRKFNIIRTEKNKNIH